MNSFVVAVIYSFAVYGSMAVMSIGAALVAIKYCQGFFQDRKTRINGPAFSEILSQPMVMPSLALGLACAWSLLWAQLSGLTFFDQAPDIHWGKDLSKLWHLVFPFVLASLLKKMPLDTLRKLFRLWFGAWYLWPASPSFNTMSLCLNPWPCQTPD
jgi:hypothetical protein